MRWYLLALLIPAVARADGGYVCMSAFAWMAPQFPREQWLQMHARVKRPCNVVVYGTFGDDLTTLKQFTDRFADRPHAIQIHLSNETARAHQVWFDGELLPGVDVATLNAGLELGAPVALEAFQDRLQNIAAAIPQVGNPRTQWLVSLGLEPHYSEAATKRLIELARSILPLGVLLVTYGRFIAGTDLVERHQRQRCNSGRCVLNEDGARTDYRASQRFLRDNRRAFLRALWLDTLQGRRPHVPVSRELPARLRSFGIDPRTAQRYGRLLAAQ
jgi:hypothetical protein